jgi:hypothetical protein
MIEFLIFWNVFGMCNKPNVLQVIAPGQFFRIKAGKSIPTIAKKGLLKKGLFGQFGFGEFMVHNWKKEAFA